MNFYMGCKQPVCLCPFLRRIPIEGEASNWSFPVNIDWLSFGRNQLIMQRIAGIYLWQSGWIIYVTLSWRSCCWDFRARWLSCVTGAEIRQQQWKKAARTRRQSTNNWLLECPGNEDTRLCPCLCLCLCLCLCCCVHCVVVGGWAVCPPKNQLPSTPWRRHHCHFLWFVVKMYAEETGKQKRSTSARGSQKSCTKRRRKARAHTDTR